MPVSVELEGAVYKWYEQEQSKVVTLRGEEIQSAADRLVKDLKIENFSASSGLWRLRNRHGLRYRKMCGDDVSVNRGSAEHFRRKSRQLFDVNGLQLHQIYSAGETDLFGRTVHRKTPTEA
jgi:hypothetical protein